MGRIQHCAPVLLILGMLAHCGGAPAAPPTTAPTAADAPNTTAAPATTESQRTQFPLTIENCGLQITIPQRPERVVVSHSGLVRNMLALDLDAAMLGQHWYFAGDEKRTEPELLDRFLAVKKLGGDGAPAAREVIVSLQPDLFYSGGSYDFGDGTVREEDLTNNGTPILRTVLSCTDLQDQRIAPLIQEIRTLGAIFDVQGRAESVAQEIERRLADVQARVRDRPPLKVVYIDGGNADPIFVAPGGYYTDMIERAGGVNLFPDATYDLPPSVEALAASAPDVVLIIQQDDWEDGLPMLREVFKNSPAAQNNRFVGIPVYGEGVLVADNIEAIARALHPDAFE
jgi:iron complex transport system substrate-binding protein